MKENKFINIPLRKANMYYVYIIQSIKYKNIYKGYSKNLSKRLKEHNSGKVKHTKPFKPWKIIFYSVFAEKNKALDFEKYLKSGSGIAFMRKRLIKFQNVKSKKKKI